MKLYGTGKKFRPFGDFGYLLLSFNRRQSIQPGKKNVSEQISKKVNAMNQKKHNSFKIKLYNMKLFCKTTVAVLLFGIALPIYPQTWQSIGPFGGDRHFVYQDPHNHDTFYTGGIGFVHRTTDDGETWISLTNDPHLGQTGVEAVIVSYSDSNKILTNSKSGMYLSTDRGQT